MPDIFLIADTHFGHKNILGFQNYDGTRVRPWDDVKEMDEAMVERWNSVVRLYDKVYHLGDVAIAKSSLDIMRRLNGRKVLIRGNHDIFKLGDYAKHFYDIRGSHKLDNFIMSHMPIHPESVARWCKGNIHGHLHNNVLGDPRYLNVSVERINYTPIAFEDIETLRKE